MTEIKKPMLATYYDKDRVKFPCMVEPKYDGCLQGGSKLVTPDGLMAIRDIVENRVETKVLSRDEEGKLCYKRITNWFNNGDDRTKWYTFHIAGQTLTCTSNHKLFTQRGYVEAENITLEDRICVKTLSAFGRSILTGMLFGDSILAKDCRIQSWRTSIISNNLEFLQHKLELLGLAACDMYEYVSGYGSQCYRQNIEAVTNYIDARDFMEWRSCKWRRRLCIPVKELLSMITEDSLSIWYADDGSIRFNNGNKETPVINLSTHRYSIQQVREFIKYFVIKYDCCPTITRDKRVGKKGDGCGSFLVFYTEDALKILNVLRTRVIRGVEYKYYYDDYEYLSGQPLQSLFTPIESINTRMSREARYDIEVEDTHCYFANNILVHNCRALCLIGTDDRVHILSRGGKEYDVPHLREWAEGHRDLLPLDGEIYNHGDLTFQQICSAVKCKSALTEKLKYVVYDKPVAGYTNGMRRILLTREFKDVIDGPVYLTENRIARSDDDIQRYHDEFVAMGYEGAIIRNMEGKYIEGRSNNLMKLKKFDTTEFEISDVLEAEGQDKGTALFKLKSGDYVFHARPTGSRELRASYLRERDNLIGKLCTIRHFGYTDGGVIPRFPVALGIRDYE